MNYPTFLLINYPPFILRNWAESVSVAYSVAERMLTNDVRIYPLHPTQKAITWMKSMRFLILILTVSLITDMNALVLNLLLGNST